MADGSRKRETKSKTQKPTTDRQKAAATMRGDAPKAAAPANNNIEMPVRSPTGVTTKAFHLTLLSQMATKAQATTNISKEIGRSLRAFLYNDIVDPVTLNKRINPFHLNPWPFYRLMSELDPDLQLAIDYHALMGARNFLGAGLIDEEGYQPTPGFLEKVNEILAEIQLSENMQTWLTTLMTEGNAIIALDRAVIELDGETKFGKITAAALIPNDSITIIDEEHLSNPKLGADILSNDYYIINEMKGHTADHPYKPLLRPEDEPDPVKKGNPEYVLPKRDIIHLRWKAAGNFHKDRLGRKTFGIWGFPRLKSIKFTVKMKMLIMYDYVRYMKNAMPRWITNVSLDELVPVDQMPGNTIEEREQAATRIIQNLFNSFSDQLFYVDDDMTSPTYGLKLPIEPEDFLITTDDMAISQTGGAVTPTDAVLRSIEEANRSIASALGVPMTLFGYEKGATYAVGKVTAQYLAGFGGGLIASLEHDIKPFLRREFAMRGWTDGATVKDWAMLFLDYVSDNAEQENAEATLDTAKTGAVMARVNVATSLYKNQLITKNEARRIMAEGIGSLKDLKAVPDGDAFFVSAANDWGGAYLMKQVLKTGNPMLKEEAKPGLPPGPDPAKTGVAAKGDLPPIPADDLQTPKKGGSLAKNEPTLEADLKAASEAAAAEVIKKYAEGL